MLISNFIGHHISISHQNHNLQDDTISHQNHNLEDSRQTNLINFSKYLRMPEDLNVYAISYL